MLDVVRTELVVNTEDVVGLTDELELEEIDVEVVDGIELVVEVVETIEEEEEEEEVEVGWAEEVVDGAADEDVLAEEPSRL